MQTAISARTKAAVLYVLLVLVLTSCSPQPQATKTGPSKYASPPGTVTQIDEAERRNLMAPDGRPLLVNFWATWCGPCREEFPDLVKLDQEFKGRIDFITISLDEPAEIATAVPQFLATVNAGMPAYLLKTPDENAMITAVSKDWRGSLPFTILYDAKGAAVYEREGKVQLDAVRTAIQKSL